MTDLSSPPAKPSINEHVGRLLANFATLYLPFASLFPDLIYFAETSFAELRPCGGKTQMNGNRQKQ